MKMPIDKEWYEKRAAVEADHEIGAGKPDYVPGFVPSAADQHYGGVIARYQLAISRLTLERDLLRLAVVRFGDRLRMSTVEPMALQQVIDDAFQNVEQSHAPQPNAASIVPPHCSGYAFSFDPGVLQISKDGSGYIAVNEDDFVLEDDRCEGENGPEGSVHWITRLDAGEVTALRDFLNGAPQRHVAAVQDIGTAPAMTDVLVWWPLVKLDDDGDPTEEVVGGRWLISEDQGGYWVEPDCMNAIGDHMGDDYTYADKPSHWLPLPAKLFVDSTDGSEA